MGRQADICISRGRKTKQNKKYEVRIDFSENLSKQEISKPKKLNGKIILF